MRRTVAWARLETTIALRNGRAILGSPYGIRTRAATLRGRSGLFVPCCQMPFRID
jgi:hypothetical protein